MSDVFLFSISGVIGVGKSTLIDFLQDSAVFNGSLREFDVNFLPEPVEDWKDDLALFYTDPIKHGLAFQTVVFNTHCEKVEAAIGDKTGSRKRIFFMERCLYDQRIFAEVHFNNVCNADGEDTAELQRRAYVGGWGLRHRYVPEPSGIIFLRTNDLRLSTERAQTRCREGETFDHGYQELLFNYHAESYTAPIAHPIDCRSTAGIPCMDLLTDVAYGDDVARQIAAFVKASVNNA